MKSAVFLSEFLCLHLPPALPIRHQPTARQALALRLAGSFECHPQQHWIMGQTSEPALSAEEAETVARRMRPIKSPNFGQPICEP